MNEVFAQRCSRCRLNPKLDLNSNDSREKPAAWRRVRHIGGDGVEASTRSRPIPSGPSVGQRMARQRSRDTGPEVAIRREMHRRGMRYRLCWPVPGASRRTIDVALPGRRVAVFIDGCFWHGCPVHATWPKANAEWWAQKIRRNCERDLETDRLLGDQGWRVVRIWEHEAVTDGVDRIEDCLRELRKSEVEE